MTDSATIPLMNNSSHIIIVGAGLVGMSLAAALAPYFEIRLYEKYLPENLTAEKRDTRPISLAYGSQQILQTLKIWPQLIAHATPINEVIVSERGALGAVVFRAQDYGLPALGYVVPLCELQDALYKNIVAQANIHLQVAPTVEAILQNKNELIVACDGSASEIREYLAVPTQFGEENKAAHIFRIRLARPHQHVAYERFTRFGTLALLPMLDKNQMQCVWTHGRDQIIDAEQIKQTFKNVIEIVAIELLAHYPLQTLTVANPIRDNVVLMGNAAHTIYPLAAQGFNLGLRDAAALAEVLANTDLNITNPAVLEAYVNWRAPDQQQIQRLTSSLVNIFDLQLPLAKPLRGLSMLALDLLPGLKKRVAQKTLGLAGKVPRLMRGLSVTPVEAGMHPGQEKNRMDSRFRGDDGALAKFRGDDTDS